uniref:Uncharacterized protein n=1 Tax=Setaria italica TaxID=4555 RepID=K4AI08_SETIT
MEHPRDWVHPMWLPDGQLPPEESPAPALPLRERMLARLLEQRNSNAASWC